MATTTENKPKKVKIKIPLTRKEQEDVYVAVNGESYLIKRGVEVEVPYYIKEVLENREKALAEAMEFEMQAASE
jgi:hypothetical protein